MSKNPKTLPPWLFYDQKGSEIFDRIVEQPDYYPPNSELEILQTYAKEIVAAMGDKLLLIEPGAGACTKIRWLLDSGADVVRYMPLEVSGEYLAKQAGQLARDYPKIDVLAMAVDYLKDIHWPEGIREGTRRTVVFFPGSSIGNYEPDEALMLMAFFRHWIPPGGGLLIGIDNPKDHAVLERAYNDSKGYTEAFNLNLIDRIADAFDVPNIRYHLKHKAIYNSELNRIEMHLEAKKNINIQLNNQAFHIKKGETIHTENSYKYETGQFEALAEQAGFDPPQLWRDSRNYYSVFYFPAGE